MSRLIEFDKAEFFRNRIAAFSWGFAAVLVGGVTAASVLVARGGAPAGWSLPAILAVLVFFCAGAAGVAVWAARSECVTVAVGLAGPVRVRRRFPFRVQSFDVPRGAVGGATLEEDEDSDGDPYFRASFALADGTRVVFAEGHHRPKCEAACARSDAALGQRATAGTGGA